METSRKKCLRCHKGFDSHGKHNRLCDRCRDGDPRFAGKTKPTKGDREPTARPKSYDSYMRQEYEHQQDAALEHHKNGDCLGPGECEYCGFKDKRGSINF